MIPISRIPIVPKLQPDEILFSWLTRIATANGFDTLNDFLEIYVWPEYSGSKKQHQKIKYDLRHDLYMLCDSLDLDYLPLELFMETSIFCGIAPLMSRSYASQHIGLLSRGTSKSRVISAPNNMISELHLCPMCQQEDRSAYGDFAFYRSHHMPGVTACYKHGCALHRYVGRIGAEKTDLGAYEPLPVCDKSLEYAMFCHDMLYSGIQCDLSSIMQLIRCKLAQKRTENLLEEEEAAAYEVFFDRGIKHYINSVAPAVSYTSQKECLALLLLLFGSVEELRANLVTVSLQSDFNQAVSERFEILSPWREDILRLRCAACGFRFFTTPHRIISGWGCPNCDSTYSDEELFRRIFDAQNDGTYTLLSTFTGMSNCLSIHHLTCGKTWKMRARSFIIENARCECEYMVSEKQARTAIESSGEFEMLTFESTSAPVQIRHLKCKRVFCWNYHKFLRYPWCKLCSPNVSSQNMFIREMKDLVGNEYTLTGNYVDRSTKVRIRHNRCNCTQEYLPARFLDGGRCSKCTPEYTRVEFARVVREISLGRYNWTGPKTNNLEIVLDTETGDEKYLPQTKILQELMRPTPSPILPLKERNLNVSLPVTSAESVFAWLCERYTQSELISLEDIKIDGYSYALTKNAIQTLVEDGKLIRITPGVFSFPGVTFAPYEIIVHKYLIRNGKQIGYLTDHSFAYELGLNEKMPQRISIATNQESQRHGRNRTFLGIDLKLHGSRIPIDNNNYPILATISFLINEKRLKCCTQGDKKQILRKWLHEKDIALADFDEYYQYYPAWSKKMVEKIYSEDTI